MSVSSDVGVRALVEERPQLPQNTTKGKHSNVVSKPWGLKWRSSIWFITLAVGLGITTDLLVYSMIVPIIPFRLQALGYNGISSLVGWLLFAYSGSIVVSTFPIAHLSERYKNRRIPLLCGQMALIASQVMLMLAPAYWLMVLARISQGISASVIWVVGLALICDTVPEAVVGKQLGLAMMGLSVGFLVGPPVAGVLDDRFGFHAPFIFGISITAVELICRLLIIEKKEAVRWDPSLFIFVQSRNASRDRVYGTIVTEKQELPPVVSPDEPVGETGVSKGISEDTPVVVHQRVPSRQSGHPSLSPVEASWPAPAQPSLLKLLLRLLKSSRAMTPVLLALIYGIMISSPEPALPLYLQATYGLSVSKIGLVYLAAVVPTFISSPLSGWYSDRGGTIISTLVCLIFALPFWVLIIIKAHLAYFLVMFAFLNFFISALISPVMAELAAATRTLEGVGYGHMYGGFNVAYGIGSSVGPVIGGQLYDHIARGWVALSLFNVAMTATAILVTICLFGEKPLLTRFVRWFRSRGSTHEREHVNEASAAAGV